MKKTGVKKSGLKTISPIALHHLSQILGYDFKNHALFVQALTHRSMAALNNERLEFLGDAALSFVIAEQLYQRFPQVAEGELSRMRATLVNKNTLSAVAQSFGVGDYLQLGLGEKRSGAAQRGSILADTLEAIMGAIYLDGGFEALQARILAWYQIRLDGLTVGACYKDPKTRLQEYLQADQLALAEYTVICKKGGAHNPLFEVCCSIEALGLSHCSRGSSRRAAEQGAAEALLEVLEHHQDPLPLTRPPTRSALRRATLSHETGEGKQCKPQLKSDCDQADN